MGIDVAHELEVDAIGLRVAAASSSATAAALTGAAGGEPSGSRPSSAGIAAMNEALTSVRSRQSRRISGQSDDLSASSARYDSTDWGSGDAITAVGL